MLSLMPLLTISCCVAYGFAVMKMLLAAVDAPVGYEDEDGFHYGVRTAQPARVE